MKKIIIYILLITIVLGSCKKVELPPPTIGDPVFSVDATLDGTALNWTAGDDDFYMFSEFSKDGFDIYTLTGRMAKDDNCGNDCEESLSFSIRGNAITPTPTSFDIDAALALDSFIYAAYDSSLIIDTVGYHYVFNGDLVDTPFGTSGAAYSWSVSNGNDSSDSNTFVFDKVDNDDFRVRLEVTTNSGCVAYFEKTITAGGIGECELSMAVVDTFNGYNLDLSMNSLGATYTWNGVSSSNLIPLDSFDSGTLTVFNQTCNGTIEVGVCNEQQQQQLTGVVIPKFTYTVDEIIDTTVVSNNEQFSTAIIEYRDENGALYSSRSGDNSNIFTISNVKDYDDNEQGEKTKKMNINYNCTLYNVNNPNDSMSLQGSGVIAVAYPLQ